MASKKQTKKIGAVMREYKTGTLHSGKKGPVVKDIKQAIAIAMSEAKMKEPLGRDDIETKQGKGKKTVYRNPKKKNIDKLRPVRRGPESWTGV